MDHFISLQSVEKSLETIRNTLENVINTITKPLNRVLSEISTGDQTYQTYQTWNGVIPSEKDLLYLNKGEEELRNLHDKYHGIYHSLFSDVLLKANHAKNIYTSIIVSKVFNNMDIMSLILSFLKDKKSLYLINPKMRQYSYLKLKIVWRSGYQKSSYVDFVVKRFLQMLSRGMVPDNSDLNGFYYNISPFTTEGKYWREISELVNYEILTMPLSRDQIKAFFRFQCEFKGFPKGLYITHSVLRALRDNIIPLDNRILLRTLRLVYYNAIMYSFHKDLVKQCHDTTEEPLPYMIDHVKIILEHTGKKWDIFNNLYPEMKVELTSDSYLHMNALSIGIGTLPELLELNFFDVSKHFIIVDYKNKGESSQYIKYNGLSLIYLQSDNKDKVFKLESSIEELIKNKGIPIKYYT